MAEVTVRVLPDWAGSLPPDSSRLGPDWDGVPIGKGSRAVSLPHGRSFKLEFWGFLFTVSGHEPIS